MPSPRRSPRLASTQKLQNEMAAIPLRTSASADRLSQLRASKSNPSAAAEATLRTRIMELEAEKAEQKVVLFQQEEELRSQRHAIEQGTVLRLEMEQLREQQVKQLTVKLETVKCEAAAGKSACDSKLRESAAAQSRHMAAVTALQQECGALKAEAAGALRDAGRISMLKAQSWEATKETNLLKAELETMRRTVSASAAGRHSEAASAVAEAQREASEAKQQVAELIKTQGEMKQLVMKSFQEKAEIQEKADAELRKLRQQLSQERDDSWEDANAAGAADGTGSATKASRRASLTPTKTPTLQPAAVESYAISPETEFSQLTPVTEGEEEETPRELSAEELSARTRAEQEFQDAIRNTGRANVQHSPVN